MAKRQFGWRTVLTVVTLLALVGMGYALREQIAVTIQNFGKVNNGALLLIIPLEILNYHAQANLYKSLFMTLGEQVRYRYLYGLALELTFVNSVFPSGGLTGFSYFGMRMRSKSISAAKATLVQMMKFILIFVSFQLFIFIGLVLLAIEGKANTLILLIGASLSTLLFVGTFGLGFIIGSKARINSFFTFIPHILNRLIHVFRPKHPETINIARIRKLFTELHEHYLLLRQNLGSLRRPLLYALLANAAEIMIIYTVYIAFGHYVNPGAVIIAYAIANFAGLISVLPGGVGIYEALMTAVMAVVGVPAAVSLPVILMYRILTMLIQLPPGYYLYHRALSSED